MNKSSLDLYTHLNQAKPIVSETSFDSGYSASPIKFTSGFTPTSVPLILPEPGASITMDSHKYFINSPLQSQYNNTLDTPPTFIQISPLKTEPVVFSPFKGSSLSPFKLLGQSPSKGAFDEWDKDFITSFEENLFGGMNDLSGNMLEELMKSPQGKAMLERRNSPLRMSTQSAVRRLKISPQSNKFTNGGQQFQQLHGNSNVGGNRCVVVKQEQFQQVTVKEENLTNDHMYGQTYVCVNTNTLSAIDPNMMSATPIKPRITNVDAPKRKLAMKPAGIFPPTQTIIIQKENQVPAHRIIQTPQVEEIWPSKEKLKYARFQFTKVLNQAVERELEILKDEKEKLLSLNQPTAVDKENEKAQKKNQNSRNQSQSRKVIKSNGGKTKSKVQKRGGKKGKYPEIQRALSKPAVPKVKTSGLERRLFPISSEQNNDPGFYPDDDHNDEEDDDFDTWTGPPPFYTQKSLRCSYDEDQSSDEDCIESQTVDYKFETIAGNRVTLKKRRKDYYTGY